MPYAIDLSSRQSARTLEQAVRHHAQVVVSPRILPKNTSITCQLEAIDSTKIANSIRRCLVLIPEVEEQNESDSEKVDFSESESENVKNEDYFSLIGTYCDVVIELGENRYLFSADVVGVQLPTSPHGKTRIALSYPDTIQIAQRRRYRRFQPARSTQVELRWINQEKIQNSGIGWLCNVSENGLSCRTELRVADQLGIGERVKIEFALSMGDEQFTLDAVLCSKSPAGTRGKMLLGLQFVYDPENETLRNSQQSLRRHLLARFAALAKTPEGADA